MYMHLLAAVGALLALLSLSSLASLVRNALAARKTGLPYLVCVANPNNILWMVFVIPLRPLLTRVLPAWLWRRVRPIVYGWEFHTRGAVIEELGPVFVIVTPSTNKLWIAEPALANDVLARRKDFTTAPMTKVLIGRFGPNVLTHDGDDWQRTRRIIAPLLNERISSLVWAESRAQAQQMLTHFAARPRGETDGLVAGCRTLAMNVLGAAGYGTPAAWRPDGEAGAAPPPGRKLTFLDAIATIAEHMAPALLLPPWVCQLPVFPASVRKIGVAASEFESHADDLIRDAREAAAGETKQGSNGLTAAMVRISDAERKAQGGEAEKTALHLSEAEMRGSIFQFTIAGYETTANTLAYAFVLLALHPAWQDWVADELDAVLPGAAAAAAAECAYEATFPRLPRCLALMYETLRLYTPVAHISRVAAGPGPRRIASSIGAHAIPARTEVYVTGACTHVRPALWGADALAFRPSRFLDAEGKLCEPDKGTFLPWSGGPRYCPGMKMSQVEFVAVVAEACRTYRVELVKREGEGAEECRRRYEGLVRDSQPVVTLQMKRPREVRLRWVRR